MAEATRDRLLKNLEEVDKSLRRSYIAQIIICLLYIYLFYNVITVEDRLEIVKTELSDVKCAIAEFDYAERFIKMESTDLPFDTYVKNINKQVKNLSILQYRYIGTDRSESKSPYHKYSSVLSEAIKIREKYSSTESGYKLDLVELKALVQVLLPLDPFFNKEIQDFYPQEAQAGESKKAREELDKERKSIRNLLNVFGLIQYACAPEKAKDIAYRMNIIGKMERYLNLPYEIHRSDILDFQTKQTKEREELEKTSKGAIKIPFAGQALDNRLAFRIGPFVILILQFLICIYFRHRNDLIHKIMSSFKATDQDDR